MDKLTPRKTTSGAAMVSSLDNGLVGHRTYVIHSSSCGEEEEDETDRQHPPPSPTPPHPGPAEVILDGSV